MTEPKLAGYGAWSSPIHARQIAEGMIGLGEVRIDGDRIYWVELRPTEGGRCVVVRRDGGGHTEDMIPAGFNARTRVHEYGGGAYIPLDNDVIFTHFDDQRVYRSGGGHGEPRAITADSNLRHADFEVDTRRSRLIAVRQDHRGGGEPVNTIVSVRLDGRQQDEILAAGNDFYASPRLSPDGSQLAWLTWNHPDMPWDAAELWVASVNDDGSLSGATHAAGGRNESIVQPQWSPDGVLHFISDRTDWWNLCSWRDGRVEPVIELEAEFAAPQWAFGQSTYAFTGHGGIVCAYARNGFWHLAHIDLGSRKLNAISTPYANVGSLRASEGRAAFIAGAPDRSTAVVHMDLGTGESEELRRAADLRIDPGYVSVPEPVEFPTEGDLTSHGFFYPPTNKDYAAPPGERPPLVVLAHGGPTAATTSSLNLTIQYYTSRGIAVLDVNYGGSTGYGRAYRERLYGQWGVVDVDDCCNGARYLAQRGLVDGDRLAIAGGSAGGYTTLSCLTFRDVFSAGASDFGISDCEALAKETHKFESRYLDRLIGPYPERRDIYLERSPIHHVDGLSCPIIFFQGLEDRVVPPNQARMMADALRKKGLPVALIELEGEQHGFRKAENIRRSLEGKLYFFSRIFGFELADAVESVEIENL
ncbi:MAG: S9 family peptidase [Phycisphaerae bacterium]|nr:S9 family peptidase [Phycisphaerae bacterium]